MPRRMPVLATADEIRRIAENAEALIDAVYDRDEDEDGFDMEEHERDTNRITAAVEALRFCALAAGELGDPALLLLIAQSIDTCTRFDDDARDTPETLGVGITLLLRAGAPVDQDIKRLAGNTDSRIREAVAEGLLPQGEAAIALLEALSTDGIAQVRNAAKKKLSAVREVAWWKGKFARDPIARLTPEEAERLKSTLEQLSTILDKPRYSLGKHEEELVSLARALPDALAVELSELVLSASDPYGSRLISLGTMMLERPGGAAALLRVCEAATKQRRYYLSDQVAEMLKPLPLEQNVAVCKEFIAYLIGLPDKARYSHDECPAWPLSKAVGKAWPQGHDLTPVLDAVLTLPPRQGYDHDWVSSGLSDAFEQEGADPTSILDRALEARLAGYPGSWKNIRGSIDTMLEGVAGPALRASAERAILSEDKDNIAWGIEQLLTRAHDPAHDPPPAEMLARFFAEPRTSEVINESHDLRKRTVPIARGRLRGGDLEYEAAAAAISVIGSVYGGVAESFYLPREIRDMEEEAQAQQEQIAKLDAFLGPMELRGPPTPEEWRILRAARATYLAANEDKLRSVLRVLPAGPWEAEDRALLDRALAALRDGDKKMAIVIGMALMAKPEEADLPLFDVLLESCETKSRGFIRTSKRNAADYLGIALGAKGGEPQNDDSDEGWGDEPEKAD